MSNEPEPSIPLADIARLDVKPGDRVLFRMSQRLALPAAERLAADWKRYFPDVQLVIVDGVDGIAVIPAESDAS